MVLSRLGNKTRIANKIVPLFPPHRTFIDMFFGAGGIYFNKPIADYNFCNDFDDDVFNLFRVMQDSKSAFVEAFELMPISESLMAYWNKNKEDDPIRKAVRFVMLSNFGYMGKPETLCFGQRYGNQKKATLAKIDATFQKVKFAQFMCQDFRDVLPKIAFSGNKADAFIYADPPYQNTTDNYQSSFNETDISDLFKVLVDSEIRFALSEFDTPFVLELAKHYGLNCIVIGERQSMKSRRTEILVTNYKSPQLKLF